MGPILVSPFLLYYPMCLTHGPHYPTPDSLISKRDRMRNSKANVEWIFSYLADKRMLCDKRWLLEGDGRFYDCGNSRDWTGYRDVTHSNDPEVVAARKRFAVRQFVPTKSRSKLPDNRGTLLSTKANRCVVPSLGDFEVEFLLPDLKSAPLIDGVRAYCEAV